MGEAATIACQPMEIKGEAGRHSNNFNVNQLPHQRYLRWHIITKTEQDENITFNVKQHHTYKEDQLHYIGVKNGSITPYEALRNLYIADVENATGHFIVRVEVCEEI